MTKQTNPYLAGKEAAERDHRNEDETSNPFSATSDLTNYESWRVGYVEVSWNHSVLNPKNQR
jgi:hypothetical protein